MRVKLGEVCEIKSGYAFKSDAFIENGIPVIRIGNITENGLVIDENICYDKNFWQENESYHIKQNDILIAMSGATVGKCCLNKHNRKLLLNQRVAAIQCSERVEYKYVYYNIVSDAFLKYVAVNSAGCAQPNISAKQIMNYEIDVPEIEEQQRISLILEKIDKVITLRRQQLSKLDELVKARFVELFGNPLDGTAKYPIHQVGEVAEAVDPQPSHRTPPIEEGGVPYVSIKDCDYKTGIIDFEGARKVSKTVLEEHLNRYTLQDGDFIIGKIGTIGKPVFVPARNDYTLSANIVLVQPNSELVSPYFLKYSFESDFVERQFAEAKNSTSQAAFGIQKVRAVEVMNPELVVQRDFERFVKQTDKSKLAVQKSLEQLETLKKSLMKQYFG